MKVRDTPSSDKPTLIESGRQADVRQEMSLIKDDLLIEDAHYRCTSRICLPSPRS